MFFLLIGGSGFIGTNLTLELLSRGYTVVSVDISPPKIDFNNENFIYRQINISNEAATKELFTEFKIDIAINLASALLPGSNVDDLCREIDNNLSSTIKLIDIAISFNVRKFIFISSGGAIYGKNDAKNCSEIDETKPISYYGWTKQILEEYLKLQSRIGNFEYIIFRPSNPYGMHQNLNGAQGLVSVVFGKILSGESLNIWGDGSVVRDYIYINDFTAAVTAALNNGKWNETYNVGSGLGASVNDIINIAKEITGKDLLIHYSQGRSVDSNYAVLDVRKLKSHIEFYPMALREGMSSYWKLISADKS